MSAANTAAIIGYKADHETDIVLRQVKYLNNIVEQEHRAVKRIVRPCGHGDDRPNCPIVEILTAKHQVVDKGAPSRVRGNGLKSGCS